MQMDSIFTTVYAILATIMLVRYIIDNIKEDKHVRSESSTYGENFFSYIKDVLSTNIGALVLGAIVYFCVGLMLTDTNEINATQLKPLLYSMGLIWLLCWTICLPLSKKGYTKWLSEAPEREKQRIKDMQAEERKNELEILNSWLNEEGETDFIAKEYDKLGLVASKVIQTSDGGHFIVDNENKVFAHMCIGNKLRVNTSFLGDVDDETYMDLLMHERKSVIDKFAKDLPTGALREEQFKVQLLDKCFGRSMFSEICKFQDLIRVQIVDKTQVDTQRTYTMESNAGKAIAGAFLGEFLMGGAPSATVGAIAGAAGERTITENVVTNKTVAYDVVLYLNRLDNSTYTIRVNSEHELKELAGTLEYILNNK